jgi:glycosyltransferase involved in cell wall biosynthesis
MFHILTIADLFHPPTIMGGPLTARRWAEGLAARGHEVTVLAPSPSVRRFVERDGDLRIVRYASLPIPHRRDRREQVRPIPLRPLREIGIALERFKPDVVHVHFVMPLAAVAVMQARRSRIAVLGTNHALPENATLFYGLGIRRIPALYDAAQRAAWALIRAFYNRCDAMTAPTRLALDLFRSRGITVPAWVVSNGVGFEPATVGAAAPAAFRHRHRIAATTPIVLYVGRMSTEKRVDVLLHAFAHIARVNDAQLVVVGPVEPTPIALAQKLGLAGRVIFTGVLSHIDLHAAYQSATVFASASEAELQGMAFLEAMAAGLPIAAIDRHAVRETVRHEENGLLSAAADASGLAASVLRLLCDRSLAQRLGNDGRRRVGEHSVQQSVGALEKIIETLKYAPPRSGGTV